MFTFLHIETDLKTSSVATACGVVTITAPVTFTLCESVSATSPVPGGRSITRKSSSPQVDVLHELLQRAVEHRPAPDDGGLRVLEEEADAT